jgi:16S rRNA C1402 N4-methylase RsmH
MLRRTHSALPHLILKLAEMVSSHQPVLYQEIIHALRPKSGARYVDGTVGAGGHAAGLLAGSEPGGLLLGPLAQAVMQRVSWQKVDPEAYC